MNSLRNRDVNTKGVENTPFHQHELENLSSEWSVRGMDFATHLGAQ